MIKCFVYLIPFLIFSFLNIFYEKVSNKTGSYFTKPFLMPFLLFFYVVAAPSVNSLVILALISGFLGDVFLMVSKRQTYTIAGIIAFLIGHISYILIFIGNSYMGGHIPAWFLMFLAFYVVAAIFLYKTLFSSIQSMRLPVMSYMIVIFIMSFMSLSRIWTVSFLSFLLAFLGSLAFIFSDALLAYNMFTMSRKNNGPVIMATYLIAQLLIVLGLSA